MKRRAFMLSVGGAAAGMVLLPRMAFAAPGVIDWYTSLDTNILDFWTNIVKPKFEAANPGVTINLVDAGDGAGQLAIADRADNPRTYYTFCVALLIAAILAVADGMAWTAARIA